MTRVDPDVASIRVVSHFRDWRTPIDYAASIKRLLGTLPPDLLVGLEVVTLRAACELNRREARVFVASGPDRARLPQANGAYFHARPPKKARIELFLDNILDEWPSWITRIPVLRHEIVNRVLFHELGHHIRASNAPWQTKTESEARDIGRVLFARSFADRHPLLTPFLSLLYAAHKFLKDRRFSQS